jgi:hypothetical protein
MDMAIAFKVGDLVTLKKFRGNPNALPPVAIVLATEAYVFGRFMIQHLNGTKPEMAAPEHWKVVSSA